MGGGARELPMKGMLRDGNTGYKFSDAARVSGWTCRGAGGQRNVGSNQGRTERI